MTTTKPLTITTSTHAMALAVYLGMGVLAILDVLDIATHATMDDQFSPGLAALWMMGTALGAGVALGGALLNPYIAQNHPRATWVPLAVEAGGAFLLAGMTAWYQYALVSQLGWGSSTRTQVLVWIVVAGGAGRTFQAGREYVRMRRSTRRNFPTVSVAGDPRHDDRG